jgi:hypothetical protein
MGKTAIVWKQRQEGGCFFFFFSSGIKRTSCFVLEWYFREIQGDSVKDGL